MPPQALVVYLPIAVLPMRTPGASLSKAFGKILEPPPLEAQGGVFAAVDTVCEEGIDRGFVYIRHWECTTKRGVG